MSEDETSDAEDEDEGQARPSIIIISDFIWPWCYIGLVEIERLRQDYEFDIHLAPFLLRPDVGPGGAPARRITPPEAPPSPVEQRGDKLGIVFNRGRATTSYSHLALEAAEFANQYASFDIAWAFHKRLFKAYFEDLADIADIEVLVRAAEETGVDAESLREALTDRRFESVVDEGIAWSRQIGVTAIPTFVFNERLGMVGAQEQPALREMMSRVGNVPKE